MAHSLAPSPRRIHERHLVLLGSVGAAVLLVVVGWSGHLLRDAVLVSAAVALLVTTLGLGRGLGRAEVTARTRGRELQRERDEARTVADRVRRWHADLLHELRTQLQSVEIATSFLREARLEEDSRISVEALERTVESTLAALYQFEHRVSSAPGGGSEPERSRLEGRALIVTPDSEARAALGATLERAGLQVVGVETGAQALHELAVQPVSSLRFDLLLTDLRLSDRSGLELCDRIAREWREAAPVRVLLRDRALEPAPEQLERALVDVELARPLTEEAIVGVARQALAPSARHVAG